MARILVTGSKGTIGRPLVKELLARGHSVCGLDLQHDSAPDYVRADIASFRQCRRVFESQEFDYVYHLAAEFGRINGEEYYDTLWQTNVIGTRNILELQREYNFQLIFSSSSEIYGECNNRLLTEDIPLIKPVIQQNDYAISKWVNEVQIINFENKYNNQCMRLRLFNAYGPGEHYSQYRSVVCLFCYRALAGEPWDVFDGYHRVFMYIDDLIPTLANACDNFIPGEVCNIGGVEYQSVRYLSDLILRFTGASPSLARILPRDAHNVVNKRPCIDRAKSLLSHAPSTSLTDGVPKTIDWMRKKYFASTSPYRSEITKRYANANSLHR